MGSPEFAVPALRALYNAGHDIVVVYCQPARPAGRGQVVRRCPVHVAADSLSLPVRTPARLRGSSIEQEEFRHLHLDAALVAAYGLILPQSMLDAPKLGCINIHASLLPRWRGAAPIQAALLSGDAETGITIMQMEAGLDAGPVLLAQSIPIKADATAANLHNDLALIGADLMLEALIRQPRPVPQSDLGVTYAPKLTRQDGWIEWGRSAEGIERQIRALNPWPGTFTTLAGTALKVLAAKCTDGRDVAGTVLDAALTVACGHNAIRLTKVQLPGRGALEADAFLRGHPVMPGTVLGQ